MKVKAYTAGRNTPSARFRIRQLIPVLQDHGIYIDEDYKRSAGAGKGLLSRGGVALADAGRRTKSLCFQGKYDACLFQKPMWSRARTLERFCKRPTVLDVDDSVHAVYPGGGACRALAKQVDVVVVGNRYLRDWYAEYAREVWILPTAIDSERFRPDERAATDPDRLVIGWIGSAATLRQLESIECALKEYFDIRPKDKLSVVSDREPRLPSLRAENVVFTSWSKESEVLSINNMDIGIMPLYDSVREKGKCAYKMLQYMACGKPVVASPVGMNGELFGLSNIGYPAVTKEDWVESLLALALSPEERGEQGGMGRDIVRRYYDKNVIGRAWVDMFSRLG